MRGATTSRQEIRDIWPSNPAHLWRYCKSFLGVEIARTAVCKGHVAPFTAFARQVLERPRRSLAIWHASRGGGKSFLSAIDTHLTSRFYPGSATRILGGSLDQSRQIYGALKKVTQTVLGPDRLGGTDESIDSLLARMATYVNGSEVEILACSPKSVRGPHVPTLKLDEVDEIDRSLRDDAMGMVMNVRGVRLDPNALFTSTWHKPQGPMSELIARAAEDKTPVYTWCVFEVLERCPESRSGRWVGGKAAYQNCPTCPIFKSCHSDRSPDVPLPKAKRSNGHYSIDSLIQKAMGVSFRTFQSDYECRGPKTEALVFPDFDFELNVTEQAEYKPAYPVIHAADSGVRTGSVLLQMVPMKDAATTWDEIHVFGDYFAEGKSAEANAFAMLLLETALCGWRPDRDKRVTDSAGGARTSIGPTVMAEYQRAGFWPVVAWPKYPGSIMQGLALIDALIRSGNGKRCLKIHPRCKHLLNAFATYERAKVNGQLLDTPADPQHPQENLMDALRGGVMHLYPSGRKQPERYVREYLNRII